MTYELVDWDSEYVATLTEAEFVSAGLKEGQYRDFSPLDQVKLLKEVYRLIGASVKT